MQNPHTAEQVSSLWLVYHGSRSNGTGRGYLSASMSRLQYEPMLERARNYPVFIIPLPCTVPSDPSDPTSEPKVATEFYFMQWNLYDRPEAPSPVDPLSIEALSSSPPPNSESPPLPPLSSVILTPLQEYKLRGSYAQPRLVLTHYTNFAHSHELVLFRGEIAESRSGNYLLSQTDAQLLALAVQRFYLHSEAAASRDAFRLLKDFHEAPSTFDYNRLIETSPLI